MLIIGITGKKGSGKDTLADMMITERKCRATEKISLAFDLKRVAQTLWDLDFFQCNDPVRKEEIDPRWGLSPREILQRLGTEVARSIHPDTWVRRTIATMVEHYSFRDPFAHVRPDVFLIPDVRFLNEVAALREFAENSRREGKRVTTIIVRIVRPSLISTDLHSSEQEMDKIEPDFTIVNEGSPGELHEKAKQLWTEIASRHDQVLS
jgi:ABC-type glutathione transport system ATPase component